MSVRYVNGEAVPGTIVPARAQISPGGAQGPAGNSIVMKGSVPTASALPATGNEVNDTYVALDTGHAWSWDGSQWNDIGFIQSIPGPPGPTGPAGENATAEAGTTTTGVPGGSANVSNVGTPSDAVFNFIIPRGAMWWAGLSPPPPIALIPGALPGDFYLCTDTGDIYQF